MEISGRDKDPQQANKIRQCRGQQQRVAIARALTMNPGSCCSTSDLALDPEMVKEVADTMA